MADWIFTSDDNLFSLTLPEHWSEYEDEDNTFAFFNTDKWSGNLRITHLYWENADPEINKTSLYRQSEFETQPDAIKVKLNDWNAVFYSNEGEDYLVYFWITGLKNDLFTCSFTFDKPFLDTDWHKGELSSVTDILSSIKLLINPVVQ